MTTEKPPLDWTKPLQTTDGVKAELVYTSKHNKEWPYLVLLDEEEKWVRDDGFNINFQLINTPETKLVVFSINLLIQIAYTKITFIIDLLT